MTEKLTKGSATPKSWPTPPFMLITGTISAHGCHPSQSLLHLARQHIFLVLFFSFSIFLLDNVHLPAATSASIKQNNNKLCAWAIFKLVQQDKRIIFISGAKKNMFITPSPTTKILVVIPASTKAVPAPTDASIRKRNRNCVSAMRNQQFTNYFWLFGIFIKSFACISTCLPTTWKTILRVRSWWIFDVSVLKRNGMITCS